ncbi:uncharacterized protein DUF397 [Amycolatopsis sulphurea]|uniref:Uncharacterized protein DUF397 n=1 Tax=Amycolatopsis sulphurea TaxID=76022 RepID=A0A2A9FI71_9PSEU|nr:DUF397 domain-containing protein [Amycolatopsis sulphurea]PFG50456.1 uncharacterized protein DUF397 [Amycolatopsis sulphurea]
MSFTGWKKAQKTHHEENACVQVGTAPGYVGIRDTKTGRGSRRGADGAGRFAVHVRRVHHGTARLDRRTD